MSEFAKITAVEAIDALNTLDDYARMDTAIIPKGPVLTLMEYIIQTANPEELMSDTEAMNHISFFSHEYNFNFRL